MERKKKLKKFSREGWAYENVAANLAAASCRRMGWVYTLVVGHSPTFFAASFKDRRMGWVYALVVGHSPTFLLLLLRIVGRDGCMP